MGDKGIARTSRPVTVSPPARRGKSAATLAGATGLAALFTLGAAAEASQGSAGSTGSVRPVLVSAPAEGPMAAPAVAPTLDRRNLRWVSCPRGAGSIGVAPWLAPRLRNLLNKAAADGVPMCGTGWRSYQHQVALRYRNCGLSTNAVYRWPARWCTPPTARPGSSMHERGEAIDFRPLRGVSRPAMYRWLKRNASAYRLYQLPSENWHYSTTGG